jgi:hypothetical protein
MNEQTQDEDIDLQTIFIKDQERWGEAEGPG